MHELNVRVESGVETLEIRTGEALKLKEPKQVVIRGTLETPYEWLRQRKENADAKRTHILVNRENGVVILHENETDPYGAIIEGKLEINPIFLKFGINQGNYKTPLEMSEFIKMNRVYFENRQVAMELVTQLRKFKVRVDKQVEQEVNLNKGDKRLALNQAVESNVPETFKVCLPIFKGMPKATFEVETYFNPNDLTCTLVSPEANEMIEDIKQTEIVKVVEAIAKECPDIVIINE